MKKAIFLFCLVFFLLVNVGTSYALLISFLTEDHFQGVDDIWGFSTTDQMSNLGTSSLSLLNGGATLTAASIGQDPILTQRGTRGLGILGGIDDEIERTGLPSVRMEMITIRFDTPVSFESLELRSFYTGEIAQYSLGFPYSSGQMYGTENSGVGIFILNEDELRKNHAYTPDWMEMPISVISLGLFENPNNDPVNSSFSLARMEVAPISPVPEPATLSLLGLGLLGLVVRKKKTSN